MCPFAPQFVQSGKTVQINLYNGSRRKIQKPVPFCATKKAAQPAAFSRLGIKKGDRPLWTVAFHCFCLVALGARAARPRIEPRAQAGTASTRLPFNRRDIPEGHSMPQADTTAMRSPRSAHPRGLSSPQVRAARAPDSPRSPGHHRANCRRRRNRDYPSREWRDSR